MRYRAFSTGVYLGLPSPIDGDRRVMVTAYYSAALTAFINTHGKRHLLSVAAIAAILARVSRINSFKRPASILSFAFRHREKASPSHIADCLGEMAILNHPADVQILDRDHVKTSDPKLFTLSFNRAGEPNATGADTGDRKFVAFDRARPNLLVFLREGVIPVFALESGESRFLSILNAPKESLESFLHTLKRILLDCPQMALYFGQGASFSQMARLLVITEGCARDLVTRNPLGKSGVSIPRAADHSASLRDSFTPMIHGNESLSCLLPGFREVAPLDGLQHSRGFPPQFQ
jgi:hypothetical protein